MFILALIAVVLFVSSLAAPVRAGIVEDCNQERDPELRISGCTAVIHSGEYSGEDLAATYNNRGFAYGNLGYYRRAIEDFDQALRLDPDYVEAYSNRAWTLHLLGQSVEALAEFERAMRVGGAAQVQAYQKALAKHGHYQGTIDGVYTPQTKAALAACLKAGCRLLK